MYLTLYKTFRCGGTFLGCFLLIQKMRDWALYTHFAGVVAPKTALQN
jgi:hypothetical protein